MIQLKENTIMTNGERIKAILNPREDQIKMLKGEIKNKETKEKSEDNFLAYLIINSKFFGFSNIKSGLLIKCLPKPLSISFNVQSKL